MPQPNSGEQGLQLKPTAPACSYSAGQLALAQHNWHEAEQFSSIAANFPRCDAR